VKYLRGKQGGAWRGRAVLLSLFCLLFHCPLLPGGAFALVVCSVHPFCLITGSEEEHSPVLKTLERRAARKLPSKSLEDIPSDSSSENKVCPTVHASPKLTHACVLACSSVVSLHVGMHWNLQCSGWSQRRRALPMCAQAARSSVSATLLLK
jgi:hypothetical protein